MLKVELESGSEVFRPGEPIQGRIVWEFDTIPESIEASLCWTTEGKGDDDQGWPIEQVWKPTMASGSFPFRWELPRGPLSLDGTLIRIRWSIECESTRPDETCTVEFILSHLKMPVRSNQPTESSSRPT